MESELCLSDVSIPAGGGSPQNAEPVPGPEAREDLDSFNLIEPPPLDWRSDTSSETGSLGASEDPSLPPPVGEAGSLGASEDPSLPPPVGEAGSLGTSEDPSLPPPVGEAGSLGTSEDPSLPLPVGESGSLGANEDPSLSSPVGESGSLGASEDPSLSSPVGEAAGLGDIMAPASPDASDSAAASPVDGQPELAGEEKTTPIQAEDEATGQGEMASSTPDVSDPAAASPVDRQPELAGEEKKMPVQLEEKDLGVEDEKAVELMEKDQEALAVGVEGQTVEEEEVAVMNERPGDDDDHTRIHALLNRLQLMGEEEDPYPETLKPFPHPCHSPTELDRTADISALHEEPPTETTGLLFSESHQRDLLGLLECTEIGPPLRHRSEPQGSYQRVPTGDVDAVVSVSYNQQDAQRFWTCHTGNGQQEAPLRSRDDSLGSLTEEDEYPEPVWMKRGEEPPPEEEEAAREGDQGADDHPAYKDVPGPCDPDDLLDGVVFGAKYLGSTQLKSDKNPSTNARMAQAQEAVDRIKAPEGETQPETDVDLFISTQRIKVLTADTQSSEDSWTLTHVSGDLFRCPEDESLAHCISEDCRMGAGIAVLFKKKFGGVDELKEQKKISGQCAVLRREGRFVYYLEAMMDHSLQMISYIADIGSIVVLMARRKQPGRKGQDAEQASNSSSSSSGPQKKFCMICHVFSSDDAQVIAQAIGQSFGVAYQQFLQTNGIKPSQLRPGEYSDFLGSQELYNGDLVHFSDSQNIRDVIITKPAGEIVGVAVVESGWGSILPTVVVANMLHGGPAERCGDLSIGDRIMSVNGTSLVGLPITTCHSIIRDLKGETIVKLSIVHCPPVTMAIIKRPDPKYQLGFSVEDGIICSLMRGGIAERGGIRVGHRIIEINGQSVVATPHEKIINILTNAIGEIHLKTMPASTYRLLTGQEQAVFL